MPLISLMKSHNRHTIIVKVIVVVCGTQVLMWHHSILQRKNTRENWMMKDIWFYKSRASFYSPDRRGLIYLENEKYLTRLVVKFLSRTYNDRVNGLLCMEGTIHCTLFFPSNFLCYKKITKSALLYNGRICCESRMYNILVFCNKLPLHANVDVILIWWISHRCMYVCHICCNIDNLVYILNIEILLEWVLIIHIGR